MENLIKYLNQFGFLNPEQIALINQLSTTKALRKGDYFSKAGEIPKQVAFIIDGVFRVLYYDHQGKEFTKYFVGENNFLVDLNSFQNKIPSSEYIESLTDSNLIVFSIESLETLSNTIIIWDDIIAKITSKALIDKVNKISPMVSEDAKTRYLEFNKRYPGLVNRIPLNHIASYLRISKFSLSRLRKEIMN